MQRDWDGSREEDQPGQALSCQLHALEEVPPQMPASSSSACQRGRSPPRERPRGRSEIVDCRLPGEEAELAAPSLETVGEGEREEGSQTAEIKTRIDTERGWDADDTEAKERNRNIEPGTEEWSQQGKPRTAETQTQRGDRRGTAREGGGRRNPECGSECRRERAEWTDHT